MSKQLKLVKTGASKRLEKLREEAKKLTGIDRALMDDLLIEYDALASMAEELRLSVQEDGVMVTKEIGSVNNRHYDTVENPAFTSYQKAIGRLGDIAKKISDFAKRSDEDVEEDELASFLSR